MQDVPTVGIRYIVVPGVAVAVVLVASLAENSGVGPAPNQGAVRGWLVYALGS
jgi:hypothetical protein